MRDYIYVEDLARAHVAVLPLTGLNFFNVGSERGAKVKDVLAEYEARLAEIQDPERAVEIWREIDRRGLPVLVHPTDPPGAEVWISRWSR